MYVPVHTHLCQYVTKHHNRCPKQGVDCIQIEALVSRGAEQEKKNVLGAIASNVSACETGSVRHGHASGNETVRYNMSCKVHPLTVSTLPLPMLDPMSESQIDR
eukprot:m.35538 g.35538  ORF g.35538 m.35538 type:complete len:104 (-) comp9900_c0_seq2:463-774(-)